MDGSSNRNVETYESANLGQRPDRSNRFRVWLYEVIFESDTRAGKIFDVILLWAILASVGVISLETVQSISSNASYSKYLGWLEVIFTIGFAVEFLLRCYCVKHPARYLFSFWGLIDLLSFLPSMLAWFGPRTIGSFVILRSFRLLRVFRVLKLWRMMKEAHELGNAVWKVREKIVVFLMVVLIAVTVSGTLMYHVEHDGAEYLFGRDANQPFTENSSDFTSIPQSMYWAIVTMTTVGYGDIAPKTTLGKCIAAALILLGYSLIIVPTGFVTAEMSHSKQLAAQRSLPATNAERELAGLRQFAPNCAGCGETVHIAGSQFCHRCGTAL